MKTLSKSMQEFLAKKGLRIDVHHGRNLLYPVILEDGTVETTMSREEFGLTQSGDDKAVIEVGGKRIPLTRTSFGQLISPNGGFTSVHIVNGENESIYMGKYNFPATAAFDKTKGLLQALRKALHGTKVLTGFEQ